MQQIRIELEVTITSDDSMRAKQLSEAVWAACESKGFPTAMKVHKAVVETTWHEQRLLGRSAEVPFR